MTTDIFRRMVWKEYRVLRAFWVTVVAIALVCQAVAWLTAPPNAIGEERAFYAIVCVAVVLYALGAAATLFAVEREEGTDAFLQALPVRSRQVFWSKVALAGGGTVVLAAALGLLTWTVTRTINPASPPGGPVPPPVQPLAAGLLVAALTVDVFVCGLFFSLVLRRPLVAACVGAVAASVTPYPSLFTTAIIAGHRPSLNEHMLDARAAIFIATLAGVFVIDVWLGSRWLQGRRRAYRPRRRARPPAVVPADAAPIRVPARPSALSAFGRLTWQELRSAWRMMAIFIGIGTLLGIWAATNGDPPDSRLALAMSIALGVVAIIGSCVFFADQERSQFRYFAERPVRPRVVWLTRQLTWLAVTAAWLSAAVPVWAWLVFGNLHVLGSPADASSITYQRIGFAGGLLEMPGWAIFTTFAILAYSCGQLCSMLLRSGIIAGFVGVILSVAVCLWAALTGTTGVYWIIAVAPIPLFLLWATWLRAPHWIGERTGWRPWTRLGLSLAVPALGVGIGTATYRVVQIPLVNPGFSPAHYAAAVTPATRETADMYLRAAGTVEILGWQEPAWERLARALNAKAAATGMPAGPTQQTGQEPRADDVETTQAETAAEDARSYRHQLTWLAANREALSLALEATERRECVFPMAASGSDLSNKLHILELLIGIDAYRLEVEGNLDAALDRELALLRMSVHMREHQFAIGYGQRIEQNMLDILAFWWATRLGQTPERIRRAIAALGEWQQTVPGPADAIEARYAWFDKLLALDPNTLAEEAQADKNAASNLDRLLVFSTLMPWEYARARRGLDYFTARDLANARAVERAISAGEPTSQLAPGDQELFHDRLLVTTPWLLAFWAGRSPLPAHSWLREEARRQATQLLLALEGWRIEHGELPESLGELVGPYFARLPRDPFSGQSFRYFPHGMPQKVKAAGVEATTIAANIPFLWSCGPSLVPIGMSVGDDQAYQMIDWQGTRFGDVQSGLRALESGWPFPISRPRSTDEAAPERPLPEEAAPDAPPPPKAPAVDPSDDSFSPDARPEEPLGACS